MFCLRTQTQNLLILARFKNVATIKNPSFSDFRHRTTLFINTVNIYFPQITFHEVTAPRLGNNKGHLSLDDLFILVAATSSNAILVSQDKFRDIVQQESTYEQFSSSNDTRYRYYTEDSNFYTRFVTLQLITCVFQDIKLFQSDPRYNLVHERYDS